MTYKIGKMYKFISRYECVIPNGELVELTGIVEDFCYIIWKGVNYSGKLADLVEV